MAEPPAEPPAERVKYDVAMLRPTTATAQEYKSRQKVLCPVPACPKAQEPGLFRSSAAGHIAKNHPECDVIDSDALAREEAEKRRAADAAGAAAKKQKVRATRNLEWLPGCSPPGNFNLQKTLLRNTSAYFGISFFTCTMSAISAQGQMHHFFRPVPPGTSNQDPSQTQARALVA